MYKKINFVTGDIQVHYYHAYQCNMYTTINTKKGNESTEARAPLYEPISKYMHSAVCY